VNNWFKTHENPKADMAIGHHDIPCRSLVDEAETQAALDLYKEFAYRSEEVTIRHSIFNYY
jgi:hypothetical protein